MRLTAHEILQIVGTSEEGLKSKRRRDQVALAFSGNDLAARRMLYSPCDAIAMLLAERLAETFGGCLAAQLVRVFGAEVLIAIAQADRGNDASFAVIDLVGEDGRRAYLACGTRETAPNANIARGYVMERVVSVNVTRLVRTVRAAKIGLDLSSAFLPAPDSTEFAALLAPYAAIEGGIVEARALRKRDTAAQRVGAKARAAMRQSSIKTPSRDLKAA